MPDFLAQELTLRFQDTGFGISENDSVVVTPSLYHLADKKAETVQYRDGREDRIDAPSAHKHEEAGPSIGLTTWGIFGPMLQTVMSDILKGKIGWSHWEQSPSGSIAVFRYVVPKAEATYRLNWCCVAAELGTFRELQMVPGYHREIAINPESGAVMRFVVISDLDASQPVSTADVFVEYGPIEIGGRTYLCPTRSATMLVAKSPIQHGTYTQNGVSITASVSVDNLNVTSINDSHFVDYHVFGSEMKIVEH